MSKKHFILVAAAIRENIADANLRCAVAQALIPALRQSNPNFNAQRFLDACTGE